MKRFFLLFSLAALLCACTAPKIDEQRPRVIVTTDGEVDDECSLVRFLLYCNEWDVEAIITSSSQYHWRGHNWAGDDWMDTVMGAYAQVYPTLVQHDARYPSPEFLRERSYLGNVDAEGEMEQVTPGSQRIVEVLLDRSDPRPVWIQAWGGVNTLARALKTIEEEHPERMQEVAARIRLYNIWEQDSTYQTYIRPHWEALGMLVIISDQFEAIAYRWHTAQPEENWPWLESPWMKRWILGAGPLGATYRACEEGEWFNPTNVSTVPREGAFPVVPGDFRSEGDSPSYMYVIPTGMNDPEHPDWGSWGGRYVRVRENVWMDPVPDNSWTYPEGRISSANTWGRLTLKGVIPATAEQVADYFRPMARWTQAFQNDFAARMSWTVLPPEEANHQPFVRLETPFERSVRPGETVTVRASATDPDGDALTLRWWQYAEAGTCPLPAPIVSPGSPETQVIVPAGAPAGSTIHLISEVTDNGQPALTRYTRTILTVTPAPVGPAAMPREIEPVDAPFEMPAFSRPVFPKRTVKVRMVHDTLSTERIQQAIDRVSAQGGGRVIIPPGVWQTGRIELKSGVDLHLSEGAELHFSGNIRDYQPAVFTRDEGVELYSLGAFIYANGQEHIALTGRGRVVGPSTDCEIYLRNQGTNLDGLQDTPPETRIFDGQDGGPVFLPKTFSPIRCKDVFVEGITFDQGLYWNIVPQYCEQVVIRGCTVESFGHGRTDGIDIDSSSDVLIEYCSLDAQDDCYTFKSGRGEDGRRVNRPTERVVVRRSLALRGAGGIVFGTETAGGVRNVYMHDCVFDGTDRAFRFKTRRPRGGFVENVWIERVRVKVLREVLVSEMLGSTKWVGELAHRYPAREVTPLTPWFRNISIHDVQIDSCRTLVSVAGLPEMPVRNMFLGNVTGRCEHFGSIQDAVKFSMKDVRVESGDEALAIDNVDYATIFGVDNVSTGQPVRIEKLAGDCKYLNIQEYPLRPVTYHSIRPGEVWMDTSGKPIQAHGFQVSWHDGKYWWYGEDKTETLLGTNRFFCGVRLYSSEDFYNWQDEGLIVIPDTDTASPLHHSQKLERPHILHCPATGRWVCWLKAQANDGHFVILEADDFTGPYHYVRSLKPCGFAVGDFDMYSDPETGRGYVWFERPHWENICAELSEDYTDVTGTFSEHFVGLVPPLTREAAAHFVKDGRHYIYTSGTTSYTPNPSEVAVFDDYHGEYTVLGDPHIGDAYGHSFCSQISSVIRIPGTELYVAMADRWQPWTWRSDIPKREYASFLARYKDHQPFPQDFEPVKPADRRYVLVNQNQDVYSATYVFLPVVWKDDIPMIQWRDEWRLEDYQ